jgi:hypothetical protein
MSLFTNSSRFSQFDVAGGFSVTVHKLNVAFSACSQIPQFNGLVSTG